MEFKSIDIYNIICKYGAEYNNYAAEVIEKCTRRKISNYVRFLHGFYSIFVAPVFKDLLKR